MSVRMSVPSRWFRMALVAGASVLGVACASSVEPTDVDEPVDEASAALTFGPGPGAGSSSGGTFNPSTCATLCTATSACDKACEGSSCGVYGVCKTCAAACTDASSCGLGCMNGSTYTTCRGAGQRCRGCSAATCEDAGCAAYCSTGPGSYARCDTYGLLTGDRDSDGLPDSLENALARRFFPQMSMTNDDWRLFYGNAAGDPTVGGLYCNGNANCQLPFVVRRVGALGGSKAGWCASHQCAEIVYGLPYDWDLGDDASAPFVYHRGDSESFALLVAHRRADDEADGADWGVDFATAKNDANAWRIVGMFYAAHKCNDTWGLDWDSSRFVWPREGATYSQTTYPMLHAAERKHASYPNLESCDGGGKWADFCGANNVFPDRALVSNRLVNVGEEYGGAMNGPAYVCAGFDTTIAYPGATLGDPVSGAYDVWRGGGFGGDKADPYYRVFKSRVLDWGNASYTCW